MKATSNPTASEQNDITDSLFRYLINPRVAWKRRSELIDGILLHPTAADLRYDAKCRRPI